MRFHNAIILVMSILVPVHSFALEKLGDGEEPVLDFRNGAPLASGQPDEAQPIAGSSEQVRRYGTTSHLSVGMSTTSGGNQDGYSVQDVAGKSASISARLFSHLALFASSGSSSSTLEYDQLRLRGPFWSFEHYTFDARRDLDTSSSSAGLRVDLFGMAPSSPYIAASRVKIKQHSDLTGVGKRYSDFSSVPLETEVTEIDEGDVTVYMTSWSIGYEAMLGRAVSLVGAFTHALNDDRHSRSFGLGVNIWLSRHLAVGVGASRHHDAETNSGGIDLSLAL